MAADNHNGLAPHGWMELGENSNPVTRDGGLLIEAGIFSIRIDNGTDAGLLLKVLRAVAAL